MPRTELHFAGSIAPLLPLTRENTPSDIRSDGGNEIVTFYPARDKHRAKRAPADKRVAETTETRSMPKYCVQRMHSFAQLNATAEHLGGCAEKWKQ